MQAFYDFLNVSRQAHLKWQKQNQDKLSMILKIIEEVNLYRLTFDQRAGSRVLFYNLRIKERYAIGVTKFEQLLSKEGLSLPVNRVRVITTKSSMQSWNYSNLISGLKISGINQVIVGDITYIFHLGTRYYFFSCIDVYSHRVIGWAIDTNMRKERAVEVLDMAMECRGALAMINTIHHTDGGGQYFSGLFLERAWIYGLRMSRAKNCLENGYAEQFNAYLKHHLMPLVKSNSIGKIRKEISKLIHHFNFTRRQEELGWMSPVDFENAMEKRLEPQELELYHFEKR